MTNFDFLLSEPQFASFAEAAVAAEKIYAFDPAACAVNCRRAMEFAVKWMYSVDSARWSCPMTTGWSACMDAEDFRAIVDEDLWRRLNYIRQTGNSASARRPQERHPRAGRALPGKPVVLHGLRGLLLRRPTTPPGTFDPALLDPAARRAGRLRRPRWTWTPSWRKTRPCGRNCTARRAARQPDLHPQAPGSVRVQDPQALHRRHARGMPAGSRAKTG